MSTGETSVRSDISRDPDETAISQIAHQSSRTHPSSLRRAFPRYALFPVDRDCSAPERNDLCPHQLLERFRQRSSVPESNLT